MDKGKKKELSGVWAQWHTLTVNATENDHKWLIPYIKASVATLRCKQCREHATAYLKRNSPEEAYRTRGYDGLFKWTVDFHNFVNHRLNYPQYTYEDAYNYWKEKCDNCETKLSETKVIKDDMDNETVSKEDIIRYISM